MERTLYTIWSVHCLLGPKYHILDYYIIRYVKLRKIPTFEYPNMLPVIQPLYVLDEGHLVPEPPDNCCIVYYEDNSVSSTSEKQQPSSSLEETPQIIRS